MKDTKRALRRHQKMMKFKKRLNQWLYGMYTYDYDKKNEFREEAMKGECLTFLRTTARPCNCWMCSSENKYVREQKQYIIKQVFEETFP